MHDRTRIGDLTERIGFIGLDHLGLFDFGEAVGSATFVKLVGALPCLSAHNKPGTDGWYDNG